MEAGSLETTRMLLDSVFKRFAELAPMCVAARAVLELALCPKELDQLFQETAERQYSRTLLFSTCGADVLGGLPGDRSVHAARRLRSRKAQVFDRSVCNKLAIWSRTSPAELVRHTARQLTPIIRQ